MSNVPHMTLRDWFAGQALSGMIAGRFSPPPIEGMNVLEAVAMSAFMWADAMIAERGRTDALPANAD